MKSYFSRGIIKMSLLILLTVTVVAFVESQQVLIPGTGSNSNEYAIHRIDVSPDCPSINCGWNCMRFIDSRGCLYCGPCRAMAYKCPHIPTCPYDASNACELRRGPDGCLTCVCKPRRRNQHRILLPIPGGGTTAPQLQTTAPPSAPSIAANATLAPPPEPLIQAHPEVIREPNENEKDVQVFREPLENPPIPIPSPNPRPPPGNRYPPANCPTPLCSANCKIVTAVNGCPKCLCRKPPKCVDEQCHRRDCVKELGADGCLHCVCPDDVVACAEVKCDPSKNCHHIVDQRTGCAIGCQCELYPSIFTPQ